MYCQENNEYHNYFGFNRIREKVNQGHSSTLCDPILHCATHDKDILISTG